MSEIVKVGGQEQAISEQVVSGLNRIVLAVNATQTNKYMANFLKIAPSIALKLHGLKLPRIAEVADLKRTTPAHPVNRMLTFDDMATRLASHREIPKLVIDTKFSNDGSELLASVEGLRAETSGYLHDLYIKYKDKPELLERARRMQQGRSISFLIHHMVDRKGLEIAANYAREVGFEPLAVVSTSKQAKETNADFGLDHSGLTVIMARIAMRAGINHLTASANDAEMIRDALSSDKDYDKLEISGTGAVLSSFDIGEHDAPSSVMDTRHAVDYFVLGRPILLNDASDRRLLDYAAAIGPQ